MGVELFCINGDQGRWILNQLQFNQFWVIDKLVIALCWEKRFCVVVLRGKSHLYCCVHGQIVAQQRFLGKQTTLISLSTT